MTTHTDLVSAEPDLCNINFGNFSIFYFLLFYMICSTDTFMYFERHEIYQV